MPKIPLNIRKAHSTLFPEEYLENLPNDPLLAIADVVNVTLKYEENIGPNAGGIEHAEVFLEAYAIVSALMENISERTLSELEEASISVSFDSMAEPQQVASEIVRYFMSLQKELEKHVLEVKYAQFTDRYQARYGITFVYEFSDGDLKRIQKLINELRDLIADSDQFEENHKERLLARLNKLQSELHKKMSDVDRLWGLLGDAGVTIGKFGKDAKPFVDLIKEISAITWRTQSRAEELPSDTPMELISHPDGDDSYS